MNIKTEPIESVPRPKYLVVAQQAFLEQEINKNELAKLSDEALKDTIKRFEETGSPVITDGHTRQLPAITAGPFQYKIYASSYPIKAKQLTALPVKASCDSGFSHELIVSAGRHCRIFSRTIYKRFIERSRNRYKKLFLHNNLEQLMIAVLPFTDDLSTLRDTAFEKLNHALKEPNWQKKYFPKPFIHFKNK